MTCYDPVDHGAVCEPDDHPVRDLARWAGACVWRGVRIGLTVSAPAAAACLIAAARNHHRCAAYRRTT